MKRIKWNNVLKAMLFVVSSGIVLYDFYYIVIYPILTSHITTFTWLGLITCILCSTYIVEFIKYVKKGN